MERFTHQCDEIGRAEGARTVDVDKSRAMRDTGDRPMSREVRSSTAIDDHEAISRTTLPLPIRGEYVKERTDDRRRTRPSGDNYRRRGRCRRRRRRRLPHCRRLKEPRWRLPPLLQTKSTPAVGGTRTSISVRTADGQDGRRNRPAGGPDLERRDSDARDGRMRSPPQSSSKKRP